MYEDRCELIWFSIDNQLISATRFPELRSWSEKRGVPAAGGLLQLGLFRFTLVTLCIL